MEDLATLTKSLWLFKNIMWRSCASLYRGILTGGVGYSSHCQGFPSQRARKGSCHPLPKPRGASTWAEPDLPVGQLDRGGDSRCGDPVATPPPMEHSGIISAGALRSLIRPWPQLHLFISPWKNIACFQLRGRHCSLGSQQTQQELGRWELITMFSGLSFVWPLLIYLLPSAC